MAGRADIDTMLDLLEERRSGAVGIEASDESDGTHPETTAPCRTRRWHAVPDGLFRSIESTVVHVGGPKGSCMRATRLGSASLPFAGGERRPTRWIVAAMITHDACRAG